MKTVNLDFPSPRALEVRSQFEQWRENRLKRGSIPDELWKVAVELTKYHSVYKVSKLLHLDYSLLKKKAVNCSLAVSKPEEKPTVSFIELPPVCNDLSESCCVDLKRPDGTQMQIRLSSIPSADLSSFIKAFIN